MVEQISLFDQDSWFGKTYQEHSAATVEKTSKPSSRKSSGLSKQMLPMCLCLKTEDGLKPDASMMTWAVGRLLGEYTMHSFGEYPNEERESHLSQILQDFAPPKYYLSEKACQGILNRAEKRGKALPEPLRKALENQAKPSQYKGGCNEPRQPR